jgi:glutaminase
MSAQLPLGATLVDVYEKTRRLVDGEVASYIPALAQANPDWFGVSLMTVDGHRYDLGDADVPFTIQSVSKPFVFGLALDQHGIDHMLSRVGVEPSGDPFNAIELDVATSRPFNPMVNTGAILTTALLPGDRDRTIDEGLATFAGRRLSVDEKVWRSESETGDRNRAMGYLMRNFGMLDVNVEAALNSYFRQCSVLVDARDLAAMAATLANRGVNPRTGQRALREENVARVLSVMSTCGMYDFAGEWLYRVGLPAKSGVSGGIVAVLPGQFGLALFSPPLDARGNSVRGISFAESLSERFALHLFNPPANDHEVVRRRYGGEVARSKRTRLAYQERALRSAERLIRVLELQGDLRFDACEVLTRAIAVEVPETHTLILDCRRVTRVDPSVHALLVGAADQVRAAGGELVLAGASAALGQALGVRSFDDVDAALEAREDEILAAQGLGRGVETVSLEDCELLDGVAPEVVRRIWEIGELHRYQPGETVFAEGDAADRLHFVLGGRVDVILGGEVASRATSLGPGSAFGELAVLYGGRRSASARAESSTVCFELNLTAFHQVTQGHAEALTIFYRNLARNLASRVRLLSEEVRALS